MQAEPEKKRTSYGFKKKKSRSKLKRPWARGKHSHVEEPEDATPNDNVASLAANERKGEDEAKKEEEEETGEERNVGEAGWTPNAHPKSKSKGSKKSHKNKKKDKSEKATEEVLSILLQDETRVPPPKLEDERKADRKKKSLVSPDVAVGKRTRALSSTSATLTAGRGRQSEPTPTFLDLTSEDSESTEESSSSSESEGPDSLDFDNLRKYPKSVLRTFCKSQHIPVEAKKRKQKSKQDYINALLAYNKEGVPTKKKDSSKSREGRAIPSQSRTKKESPFYRPTSPQGSRYLASSQPAYLPSFARGLSEEEMLAIAVEESLKEHAKEQQKRDTEGEGEKANPIVEEAKEKGEKGGDGEDSGSDDEHEKEKKGEKGTGSETAEKKRSGEPPRWMSRSLEVSAKETEKQKQPRKGGDTSTTLDGAQFDSDEAFARALQRQLQREAELSGTDSDDDEDEDSDDSDDDEVSKILDRSQGLMYMLELLAQQRGRTLGIMPPPYLPNDSSFQGPLAGVMRGPNRRFFGSGPLPFQDIDPDNMTYEELLELGERIGEVKKKGVTQSVIAGSTQAFNYRPPKADEDRKENSRCPICLNDFEEGEEVRMLPCIHLYHKDCVDKWLQLNATCCVCQRPLAGSQL